MRQNAFYRWGLYRAAMCALLLLCQAFGGSAQTGRIADSLRQLYFSVTPVGDKLIVDQGEWKAIFSANGKPLTPFAYKNLMPGLDGAFVSNTNSGYVLLDSTGNIITAFTSPITSVDQALRQYIGINDHTTNRYNASGIQIEQVYLPEPEYRMGLYRFSTYEDGRNWQGVKDTSGRIILPQVFDGNVSIDSNGIAAIKGDTAFIYNRKGELRFSCRADGVQMLPHAAVAIGLYGLWGVKDSTGKTIVPFEYHRIGEHLGDNFFQADNSILSYGGKELASGYYTSVAMQPGNWVELSLLNVTGSEIRDDSFRLVFRADEYQRSDFIGMRFIRLHRDYNDNTSLTYDRKYRRFTNYLVESALTENAYVIYTDKPRQRRILKGDQMLKLPRFTDVKEVEHYPFFIITDEGDGGRAFLADRSSEQDWPVRYAEKHHAEKCGLLDSGMRVIVPLRASNIQVLGTKLIYAYQPVDSGSYIYSNTGKVLLKLPGMADVRREGALIRITTADRIVLLDSTGHVFYRGGRDQPILLYPSAKAQYQSDLPVLLLYDDQSGFSGLYDLAGKQLLPHQYYAVAQRVPGLFSLKRGDSVYFVSTMGRLLYGGRGFAGRAYIVLEGYGILMPDARHKWGVLGTDGRPLLPFIYDSVFKLQVPNEPVQYGLAAGSKFALLDNTGRLRYPLQSWKPARYLAADYYLGSDGASYQLSEGQAKAVAPEQYWPVAVSKAGNSRWDHFREIGQGSVMPSGIYSNSMRLLAPWYPNFNYRKFSGKIVVTDSAKQHIAVLDTFGNRLVPFINNPAVLLVNDSAIIALYRDNYDLLFHRERNKYIRREIRADSSIRAKYLNQSTLLNINNGDILPFVTRDGIRGIVSSHGKVLLDPDIDTIYRDEYYAWRVRKGNKWGLLNLGTLEYIQPPDADSIAIDRQQHDYLIFRGALRGLFHGDRRIYLPPVFERIFSSASLVNGFIAVKTREGFAILDKRGRRVSPYLDSIIVDAWTITNTAVIYRGEEASLSIADNGSIRIDTGLNARIKRTGITGAYANTVVVQIGDKQGLYSNQTFRMVLPPVYDAIETAEGRGFVAWKYKPDKHQGIDSTLIADAMGHVFCRLKRGYNPQEKDGYWFVGGSGNSPLYTLTGDKVFPEGYAVSELIRNSFFIVRKNGKCGIITQAGKWIIPLSLDDIVYSEYDRSAFLVGSINNGSAKKYCLISPQGHLLTKPVYDEIKLNYSQVLFKRGAIFGHLDANGKETIGKWPKEEIDE